MKIIIGLGNPTSQYNGTRHNIGFDVINKYASTYNINVDTKKHKALIGKGIIEGEKVILVKPQTYMNLSGESVRAVMDFYKCTNKDVVVIYDDIALAPGKIRIREKGSAGGHNGIKNIISHLQTEEFDRIRVGVGEKPKNMDLADYVLSRFGNNEKEFIEDGIDKATGALDIIISENVTNAMNKYNGK